MSGLTPCALFGCLAVCIKVINDIKEAAGSEKNLEKIEGVLQRVCAGVTTTQEKKLVRLFALPRGSGWRHFVEAVSRW